jgi:hypothetical protein
MKWLSRDALGVDEVMEGEREIVSSQILRRVWRSGISSVDVEVDREPT